MPDYDQQGSQAHQHGIGQRFAQQDEQDKNGHGGQDRAGGNEARQANDDQEEDYAENEHIGSQPQQNTAAGRHPFAAFKSQIDGKGVADDGRQATKHYDKRIS